MRTTTSITLLTASLAGLAAAAPAPPPKPNPEQSAVTSCSVTEIRNSWRGNPLWDHFHADGTSHHSDVVGAHGEHLLSQLKGCGIVTGWTFDYTNHGWTAQWNLAPLQHKCAGHALDAVGGINIQCRTL
ncbi:hypothetical protein PG985_009991 [Apiospora marii]|uniref:uncharacterized protein n=1 Tax=Apiospora marii TaxID=335849 RepID=UPI00312E2F83